jgi:abortive infection bacteriophage resistance protein
MNAEKNEEMNEDRYQFVLKLYLIRKQYPKMSLLQPDFIWVIFRSSMPSKYIRTVGDIYQAVNDWCGDPVTATIEYGSISKWNTSLVTNMKALFWMKRDFSEDISKWNVSNVTNTREMFRETRFNGNISGWDMSSGMFLDTPFNGNISRWNVSSVS